MSSMIVAPNPAGVEEGAKVLKQGGNAIDAALTCAFVQGIVNPQMCGIGGYALLSIHVPGQKAGESLILDAPALAGSKVRADMWQDRVIGPNPDGWGYFLKDKVNDVGYTSICTPGTVKGFAAMLERWGTRSWSDILQPAIKIAEEGFVVDPTLSAGWRAPRRFPESATLLDYILANPEARRIYLKADGTPYNDGDIIRNPDFGQTLRRLAANGPEDFYRGELAEEMARDLAANGSFVTAEDFANYRFRDVKPVIGSYRDYTIVTVNAPHGGPTMLEILNILEGYDLSKMEHNGPEYLYLLAMAMKAGFADRNPYMADPDFNQVPVDWMISKERAAIWRERINKGEPIEVSFTPTEPPHTTQVTVVDKDGMCVSLTHSLGMSSGVITPGLGFMYNNSMINFHPYPGHMNSFEPGKGRTTGMAPTIVYKGDKPVLVLGAPGATRILTSVLQVIVNVLDFGMSVSDAVLAPRIDSQGAAIRAQARIPEYVCAEVRKRHPIVRMPQSHGGLGLVHAITIDEQTGELRGAADTGAGGMALKV